MKVMEKAMDIDFSKEDYVPDSVTVYNNVRLRPGSPDYVVVQARIEVFPDGGSYSLQTGEILPGESKGLFYSHNENITYKLVIEGNYVTTWTSTKWDVLRTEEIAKGGYTFVVDGDLEHIDVRKFVK